MYDQILMYILLWLHEVLLKTVIIIKKAISMLGIKEMPPNLGMAFLWIFLALGKSYKFFSLQKLSIRKIIKNSHIALIIKVTRLIKM